MARMSIDDKFLRDARVVLLGRRFGWSRRETMGAMLDLFALAYDREEDVVSAAEIDVAAGQAGFADALIDVDLGAPDARGVRIKGAGERIEYLVAKREAGRKGGRKSGESRRNNHEAKRSTASRHAEARGNPPDPVPDVVPDPVPDQIPDPPRARAILPVVLVPDQPAPAPAHLVRPAATPPDHREIDARRVVGREVLAELEAARERVSIALNRPYRRLAAQDPVEREIAIRVAAGAHDLPGIRDELLHVVAMAATEAEHRSKSLQWLTGSVFSEGNYRRFASGSSADFMRPDRRRDGDVIAIAPTPAEMDVARTVLAQLSKAAGIEWRVEDGHAGHVVARHRELVRSGVDPVRAGVELQAVAADRGDELAGKDATRGMLKPSFVFGAERFAEHLTSARAAYCNSIDDKRKAAT